MNLRPAKILLAGLIVGLVLFSLPLLVYGHDNRLDPQSNIDGACAGPGVGAGGNDSDNPFRSLAVHPTDPNTVIVGSEGNGIFKTIDGGASWQWLKSGLQYSVDPGGGWCAYPETYEVIFDLNDPTHLLAATTGYFYFSLDGGAAWQRVEEGLHNPYLNSLAQSPVDPQVLYLGTDNSVYSLTGPNMYQSADGGASWTGLTLPVDDNKLEPILIDPTNPSVIYCVGNGASYGGESSPSDSLGPAKSTDGGASWSRLQNGLPAGTHYSLALDENDPQVLYLTVFTEEGGFTYKSTDGGEGWAAFPGNYSINNLWRLRVSPHDSQTLIGSCMMGACTSTDGGQSWVISAPVSPADIEFSSEPNVVYLASDYLQVYKSIDAGLSFLLIADLRVSIINR